VQVPCLGEGYAGVKAGFCSGSPHVKVRDDGSDRKTTTEARDYGLSYVSPQPHPAIWETPAL